MEKWNLAKGPPPSWLDAADELTHDPAPKLDRPAFVVAVMDAAIACGCSPRQAAGVTANAINEAAGGKAEHFFNAGGWKLFEPYARAYRKEHGKGPPWWEAPGNKAKDATPHDLKGGDPPWCQYRVFASREAYVGAWIEHFVPRPGGPLPYPGYRRTGELFWAGDPGWFEAMCRAGYKGANTQRDPSGAVAEHASLVHEAIARWAQAKLADRGLYTGALDGKWGPQSRAACGDYQARFGLPVTGEADETTLALLATTR